MQPFCATFRHQIATKCCGPLCTSRGWKFQTEVVGVDRVLLNTKWLVVVVVVAVAVAVAV